MNISSLIQQAHARIDKQRRYYRMVAEIQALSQRDLSDMRADRSEMLYWARKDVFG